MSSIIPKTFMYQNGKPVKNKKLIGLAVEARKRQVKERVEKELKTGLTKFFMLEGDQQPLFSPRDKKLLEDSWAEICKQFVAKYPKVELDVASRYTVQEEIHFEYLRDFCLDYCNNECGQSATKQPCKKQKTA